MDISLSLTQKDCELKYYEIQRSGRKLDISAADLSLDLLLPSLLERVWGKQVKAG
jgi:hypothetical protein